jgi:hypothetical protein
VNEKLIKSGKVVPPKKKKQKKKLAKNASFKFQSALKNSEQNSANNE